MRSITYCVFSVFWYEAGALLLHFSPAVTLRQAAAFAILDCQAGRRGLELRHFPRTIVFCHLFGHSQGVVSRCGAKLPISGWLCPCCKPNSSAERQSRINVRPSSTESSHAPSIGLLISCFIDTFYRYISILSS